MACTMKFTFVIFYIILYSGGDGKPPSYSTSPDSNGYEYDYNYMYYKANDDDENENKEDEKPQVANGLFAASEKHEDADVIKFLNGLLVGYDQRIRPNNEDVPVRTNVSIFVNSFYSVNEQTMDYKLNIFLRLRWNDPRLSHDFGKDAIALHPSMMAKIWKPDVFFSNEKHAMFHSVTSENKLLRVYQNGDIYTSVRLTLTLSCDMHLRYFPMDVQVCEMVMESFGYDMKALIFDWDGPMAVQLPKSLALPQFLIRGYRLKTCTKVYSTGSFTCLGAEFILQRQMGYYIIQMYAPSLMIVILSWVAFWINMDAAPARTALGITTVLTMTTQSSGARASLPKVSYVKAIDVWFAVCLLFVFAALIEFAVVNFLSRQEKAFFKLGMQITNFKNMRQPTRKRKDRETEITDLNLEEMTMNTISPTSLEETKYSMIERTNKQANGNRKERYRWKAKKIDRISRILFPLTFLVFNLFYWILYKVAQNDINEALDGAIPYK